MEFSTFGQKFTRHAGITQLMDDLNQGLTTPDTIMLGGGNPAAIPKVLAYLEQQAQALIKNGDLIKAMANYDGPQGKNTYINALAKLLSDELGWAIGPEHIALTNGSQTAFFYLFNLLAGEFSDGRKKKVLFPLAPEYIGYGDGALSEDHFKAYKPTISLLDEGLFKYHVDFDSLEVGDDIGLICVSRPTNPTGNVLTDEEVMRLDILAREKGIPLLIDNAYGMPFPNIIFSDVNPFWNDNTILCMSLSKLGLPGVRCGIVVAKPELIKAMTNISGIINLAPGSVGPAMTLPMMENGDVLKLSNDVIKPFYQQKAQQAVAWLQKAITLPQFHIHKPEGALFLWLWFEDLPIHCQELYERLKKKGLLVVPGHYFFPGIEDEHWAHSKQCIRLNYAQPEEDVQAGIKILAEEIYAIYQAPQTQL
ncbi:valine--pyruvate transaminase [Oceanisphaera avium]|uniref:Valine--pyruvate transaminase n=1 Tax=Oceanisphaera avium TaxID=1903694 RepID=A0A1Y0CYW4_9GAMM|nr:valine--pyruvate transaminase [Oceanisphaera avium]ART80520.1 valine--pyruvate transaminase [Oceanisphaera avium]